VPRSAPLCRFLPLSAPLCPSLESRVTSHGSRVTSHESRVTSHESRVASRELHLAIQPMPGCTSHAPSPYFPYRPEPGTLRPRPVLPCGMPWAEVRRFFAPPCAPGCPSPCPLFQAPCKWSRTSPTAPSREIRPRSRAALAYRSLGVLELNLCTFTNNSAGADGGALWVYQVPYPCAFRQGALAWSAGDGQRQAVPGPMLGALLGALPRALRPPQLRGFLHPLPCLLKLGPRCPFSSPAPACVGVAGGGQRVGVREHLHRNVQ